MEGSITGTIEAKADTSIRASQGEAASKRGQLKKTVLGLAAGTAAVVAAVGVVFFLGRRSDYVHVSPSASKHISSSMAGTVNQTSRATEALPTSAATEVCREIAVDWFYRNLPANKKASTRALEYAERLGVELAEGQTIVRPQTRVYRHAA